MRDFDRGTHGEQADDAWLRSPPTGPGIRVARLEPHSRKVANLRRHPAVSVTTDSAFSPVVVEGEAREVTDSALIKRFGVAMDTKYETTYGGEFYLQNVTFAIRPVRVIGIDGDDFVGSATRWVFGDA